GRISARLDDVDRFLAGELDNQRLAGLVWGLASIDWAQATTGLDRIDRPGGSGQGVPAYAILKLCAAGQVVRGQEVPLNRVVFRWACSGQLPEASRLASRRLRASGLPPAVEVLSGSPSWARRCAGAV